MSLVASRPRAGYRVYDADDFIAGAIADEEARVDRGRSTRARPAAAGLASAVLAALVAFAAIGERPAARRSPLPRWSGHPLAGAPVARALPAQLAAARIAARTLPRRIPAPVPARRRPDRARTDDVAASARRPAGAPHRGRRIRPRLGAERPQPPVTVALVAPSASQVRAPDAPRPAVANVQPPSAAPASPATSAAQFGFERGPR